MNAQLLRPLCQQIVWRNPEMQAFAVALVTVGLHTAHFGTDDVAESAQPAGHGIAGSVCEMLKNAHVIEHWYGSDPASGIVAGRRRSKRESANGRKVDIYRVVSRAAAEAWLARAGRPVVERQAEMFMEYYNA